MSIVEKLKTLLIAGNFDAIYLACDLLGKIKIVDLSEKEVARLVELLKPKEGA